MAYTELTQQNPLRALHMSKEEVEIGRASCRERV